MPTARKTRRLLVLGVMLSVGAVTALSLLAQLVHPNASARPVLMRRTFVVVGTVTFLWGSTLLWSAYSESRKLSLNRNLFEAAREKRSVEVTRLLRAGADPNARDTMTLGKSTWFDRVRAWISREKPERAHIGYELGNKTPLFYAGRDQPSLRALLQAGADPDLKDDGDFTPADWVLGSAHGSPQSDKEDKEVIDLLGSYSRHRSSSR